MGSLLLRRNNKHDLYEWSSSPTAHPYLAIAIFTSVTIKASLTIWHGLLGHPTLKIFQYLVSSGLVSLSFVMSFDFTCSSCLCNKS